MQKKQGQLKTRSLVSRGSIPVGEAGWLFQFREWHADNTSTVLKMLWCVSCQLIASLFPHIFRQPFTFSLKWEQCHSAALFPSRSSSQRPPWPRKAQPCCGDVLQGEEEMLSGVRLMATLSGAQPVGLQMWPFHRAKPFLLQLYCSLQHILSPKHPISEHLIPIILTSWSPTRPKLAVLVLGTRAGALLKVKAALCTSGGPQGSPHRDHGATSRSQCFWHQLDLSKLCPRPLLGPHLQILAHTCPRAPYQMMPNHAEMSDSLAM